MGASKAAASLIQQHKLQTKPQQAGTSAQPARTHRTQPPLTGHAAKELHKHAKVGGAGHHAVAAPARHSVLHERTVRPRG